MSTPSQHHFSNGKAPLRMRSSSSCLLFTVVIIAVAIWNNSLVNGAPAKLDALVETTPFNLNLQPPVFEASFSGDDKKTRDSYGNPIASLKPIDTPDGRKVVSAQGLQFEIPNYASGITELKKPSDDLLPPFVDPIAVAVPNDSSESTFTTITSSPTATDVHIENIPLVEVKDSAAVTASLKRLPEYIVELNDPDIGGPVDYIPADDNKGLSIIAWDLLPPFDADPAVINAPSKQRVHEAATTSHSVSSHASTAATSGRNSTEDQQQQHTHIKTSQTTPSPEYNTESTTKFSRTQQSNRGNVHYSSTTPRTTTTKRPTTTTSTTTTTTTTTRRPTTTPRTTTTTTKAPRTTSTTPQPDSSEFFKLEAGDSYTLPSWLADFDDPDLDVAVAYVVPEDVNNYNHTIARDILPPLEPYTDLNVVNVTPPPGFKGSKQSHLTTTTTPTTTTTRKTTTTTTTPKPTTTTRRSAVTSSQHWVRAKVTSPPPSARPNTSSFSNQFTSSSQTFNSPPTLTTASAGNSNLAQRTTTSTSTTTTTTTVKPKTTLNSFNHPLSNTDKISSEDNQRQQNPFLSGVNKPQPFSKPAATTTTRRTTTTTTTTTTPAPKAKVDPNPFEATIPPWLKDFDYPDVGPGVPFIYNPKDDESAVDADIQPPSMANAAFDTAAATKATTSFVTSPTSADSFLNSQNQQSFSNKFSSSATSLTPSSSIPSKVTLPLPSIVLNQDDNSVTQPPNTFVRPTPTLPAEDNNASKKTSSSFNTHFPARFEPSAGAISTDIPTKVPLGADRESFPPFNTPATGSSGSSIPTKTTFSKSEDGKVITNNIFLSGGATQTAIPTKSSGTTIPVNTQQKDNIGNTSPGFTKPSTADASFNQFTTSSGASGFVTAPSAASSEGTKYTGRFGGPPGVLAPNAKPAGFVTAPTTSVTPQSLNKQSTTAVAAAATTSAANNSNLSGKFTGSFGGPPGVLTPYDNVKSA